jgi:hypothetical protein
MVSATFFCHRNKCLVLGAWEGNMHNVTWLSMGLIFKCLLQIGCDRARL